jgi:hypothetical protein
MDRNGKSFSCRHRLPWSAVGIGHILLHQKINSDVTQLAGAVSEQAHAYKNHAPRPAWLHLVVPSVSDLVFILLLIALTMGPLAKGMLGDAGIGWHIRTGELIAQMHSIPRTDTFSSTTSGKAWFAWEWLYDLMVGWLHHVAGLNGVVFFSAVILAFTFAFVLRKMLSAGSSPAIAVIVMLMAVAASTVHFLARPHILSWLFAVFWFNSLDRFEADGRIRPLVWLPLTMLFWVNLHGGFVTGFALLSLYLFSALLQGWAAGAATDRTASFQRARILCLFGIVCAFVSLGNPYGYKLYSHIYRYLGDRFLMDHIDEFLSPNFHGLPQKFFAVLVLLAFIAMATARKKISSSHLLIALFAIYTGLYATRNIPVSSILLALIVAPQLSMVLKEAAESNIVSQRWRLTLARLDQFGSRMANLDASLRGHLWPIFLVLVWVWICAHHGHIGNSAVMHSQFDDKRFPVQATNFLESVGDRQPIFCPDSWGGYLIYRLYPHQPVAVDDRHDLYGSEFLKLYLNVIHGHSEWEQDFEAMRVGWVLVPKDSTLATLISKQRDWSGVYRDETAVLFRRNVNSAAR